MEDTETEYFAAKYETMCLKLQHLHGMSEVSIFLEFNVKAVKAVGIVLRVMLVEAAT